MKMGCLTDTHNAAKILLNEKSRQTKSKTYSHPETNIVRQTQTHSDQPIKKQKNTNTKRVRNTYRWIHKTDRQIHTMRK